MDVLDSVVMQLVGSQELMLHSETARYPGQLMNGIGLGKILLLLEEFKFETFPSLGLPTDLCFILSTSFVCSFYVWPNFNHVLFMALKLLL